jgi:hypothetical protein
MSLFVIDQKKCRRNGICKHLHRFKTLDAPAQISRLKRSYDDLTLQFVDHRFQNVGSR